MLKQLDLCPENSLNACLKYYPDDKKTKQTNKSKTQKKVVLKGTYDYDFGQIYISTFIVYVALEMHFF